MNQVDGLRARYGMAPRGSVVLGAVPTTADLRPMGPLIELTMRRFRDQREETWAFGPFPRLCFSRQSKRLWVLGGAFRIDGEGFHARGGRKHGLRFQPIEEARRDPKLASQLREFRRTHKDLDPIEAVEGELRIPRAMLALGECLSVVYKTDRRDGDGRSEWQHPFEDEGVAKGRSFQRPWVCTDSEGLGLWFAGGSYTVIDGWLAG